jgi:hypothetical protein
VEALEQLEFLTGDQMAISVPDKRKILIAKQGPNKLFGDPDKRQKEFGNQELTDLFDQVWDRILRQAVNHADVCDSKEAPKRLTDMQRKYFDSEQEHRQFRLKDMEFIAQLSTSDGDQYTLTQLWRISSSDINPKTLYITFESVEERERFRRLATKLGWNDEALGLQLVIDYMTKFPEGFLRK